MRKVSSNVSNYAKNRVSVGSIKTSQPKSKMTEKEIRIQKAKKAVKIGAVAAGMVLAAYGAYKVNKFVRERNYRHHHNRILDMVRPTLKNEPGKFVDQTRLARDMWVAAEQRNRNDSFGTAVKNVVKDEIAKRRY